MPVDLVWFGLVRFVSRLELAQAGLEDSTVGGGRVRVVRRVDLVQVELEDSIVWVGRVRVSLVQVGNDWIGGHPPHPNGYHPYYYQQQSHNPYAQPLGVAGPPPHPSAAHYSPHHPAHAAVAMAGWYPHYGHYTTALEGVEVIDMTAASTTAGVAANNSNKATGKDNKKTSALPAKDADNNNNANGVAPAPATATAAVSTTAGVGANNSNKATGKDDKKAAALPSGTTAKNADNNNNNAKGAVPAPATTTAAVSTTAGAGANNCNKVTGKDDKKAAAQPSGTNAKDANNNSNAKRGSPANATASNATPASNKIRKNKRKRDDFETHLTTPAGWPPYPAYPWVPPPMPTHYFPQGRENAAAVLKTIDNVGQADDTQMEKQKNDDFEAHLTCYFTLPTVPSVHRFCRDGQISDRIRKRIYRFLKDHPPLRKLLDRSKSFTSDLQSEVNVALKTAVSGRRKKDRDLNDEGLDSSYWQSKRASTDFGPYVVGPDTETDVLACVKKRLERLRKGFLKPGGWRSVVHGSKEDQNLLTDHDVFWLMVRCRYVATALEVALEKMPVANWRECCTIALEKLQKADGLAHIKRERTIEHWHRQFRLLGEQFANPAMVREDGRPLLPPLFEKNPEAKDIILKHAKEHPHVVSVEYMRSFCHDQLLPQLAEIRTKEWRERARSEASKQRSDPNFSEKILTEEEIEEKEVTVEQLLSESRLKKLNIETVRHWMHALGFRTMRTRKRDGSGNGGLDRESFLEKTDGDNRPLKDRWWLEDAEE